MLTPHLPRRSTTCWTLGLVVLLAGCRDEAPACYEGEYQTCLCGEQRGLQRCEADGYAACVCDGLIPGLVGGAGGTGAGGMSAGGGGAEPLPFLSACEGDEQCASGLCHLFAAKGQFCTKPCGGDNDCEPPSPGCNMMGICKAP